jgi:hypothetical protein
MGLDRLPGQTARLGIQEGSTMTEPSVRFADDLTDDGGGEPTEL